MATAYQLKVTQWEQICRFELTWGQGQQLTAQLPYSCQLKALYEDWQQAYLSYYKSAFDPSQQTLRGQAVDFGNISVVPDRYHQLVQAEADLVPTFHQWLRRRELFDIRRELNSQSSHQPTASHPQVTDILITCDPPSLGRLPWETWELTEFGTRPVRIARLPINVGTQADPQQPRKTGKTRILVILGDDTGLDFAAEKAAIASLSRYAEIKFIGWQPGTNSAALRKTVRDTIQAPPGWDVLLFFGHSNEANTVGGEIAIAPNTTFTLRELEPALRQAQAQGLKFALFNSCNGIDIANKLIDLGLSQVVVMREPIHNQVAQVFFVDFLQSLTQYDDVHTAIQKATQTLASEHNLTYPSAHLVPSLFRHGDAQLFRLLPTGLREELRRLLPQSRWQVVPLVTITALSLFSPVTELLIAHRLQAQAIYRQTTGQIEPDTAPSPPPVILLEIDENSIVVDEVNGVNPMNREYLARIVDRLSELNTQVIGIDYMFDRVQKDNDSRFIKSLKDAADKEILLVFAAFLRSNQEVGVNPKLANPTWFMQGYVNQARWYLRPPSPDVDCGERCPFSYLLSLVQVTRQTDDLSDKIIPNTGRTEGDFRQELLNIVENKIRKEQIHTEQANHEFLRQLFTLKRPWWGRLSRRWNQRWLISLLDFSMPPKEIYASISSSRLLADDFLTSPLQNDESERLQFASDFDWENTVVLIAGNYEDSGIHQYVRDYVTPPPAIAHWEPDYDRFTGGQANAYSVHHFLQQHYITPVPDLWLVGLSAIASTGFIFLYRRQPASKSSIIICLSALSLGYGLVSLQLYVSSMQLLLPWLLPTATIWVYALPILKPSN